MRNHSKIVGLLFLIMMFQSLHAQVVLQGVDYQVDTLQRFKVGPGTHYTQLRMCRASDGNGRLDVYLLHTDRRNPYVNIQTVLSNDSVEKGECPTAMAERKSTPTNLYFAGTNGDWWSTTRPGVPAGAFVAESTIAITPGNGRAALAMVAIDKNDSLYFGHSFFTDLYIIRGEEKQRCTHVNDLRYENELVIYNRYNGYFTHTDNTGTEVLCRILDNGTWGTNKQLKLQVESIEVNQGNMAIADGCVVLSATGEYMTWLETMQVGEQLTLAIQTTINDIAADYKCALGGQDRPFMLCDGVVSETWAENHPRTALGASQTGDTIIFCVVDGRGRSVGCTTGVLGDIMKSAGAWNAMNMEGGGSSSMNIHKIGIMNVPSDGSERAESNGIFAVATVPADDPVVNEILPYETHVRLPEWGLYSPKFLGYNQYGILLDTDLQGVSLSCPESVGYIDKQGRFVCKGSGMLTATYGELTCNIGITLYADAVPTFRLDEVLVSDDTDYSVEVTTTIGNKQVLLQPSALRWSVKDPSVCTVSEEGVLNGLKDKAETEIYGELGEFADTLLVKVEIPETRPLFWNSLATMPVEVKPSSMNCSVTETPDKQTEIAVDFTAGRDPNIKFTIDMPLYSLPKILELRYNPQGFPLKDMIFNFRAHNSLEKKNYLIEHVHTTGPSSVYVDLNKALDVSGNDIAIYPVMFNSLKMSLAGEKGEYKMLIEGIYLHYDEISLGVDCTSLPSFTVYPNPASGETLFLSGYADHSVARLYDLQGNMLRMKALDSTADTIDISGLPVGVYVLHINGVTVKVIKKKS